MFRSLFRRRRNSTAAPTHQDSVVAKPRPKIPSPSSMETALRITFRILDSAVTYMGVLVSLMARRQAESTSCRHSATQGTATTI